MNTGPSAPEQVSLSASSHPPIRVVSGVGMDETSSFTGSAAAGSFSQRIPLPRGQENAPMSALYTWINQGSRMSVSQQNYVTWDNGGPDHEKWYTSIFVHPATGECFPSGYYGDLFREGPGVVWYSKKKLAEHAAAARAYDCLTYRVGLESGVHYATFSSHGVPSAKPAVLPDVDDLVDRALRKAGAKIMPME